MQTPAPRPTPVLPGLLTTPARPSAAPALAGRPAPVASQRAESKAAAAPVSPERAAMRADARPWRERGVSGFSDWPNDTYIVRDGDADLTAIAWLVYRDGGLWPRLWLSNRDVLTSPDQLTAGTELLVPPPGPLTAEERAAARALHGTRASR
jgi:nucleoid-associated protein YgaU